MSDCSTSGDFDRWFVVVSGLGRSPGGGKGCPLRVLAWRIPWTVSHQASLSVGFSRKEYWSGLPFPSPGALPSPEIEPMSPALADRFFTTEPPGKPKN